jgi:hypothetical protein
MESNTITISTVKSTKNKHKMLYRYVKSAKYRIAAVDLIPSLSSIFN